MFAHEPHAKMFRHDVENFGFPKRLADEIIAAGGQHRQPVMLERAGRQRDNGGRLPLDGLLDAPRRFIAVHHRHAHVHPNQMRQPSVPNGDGLLAVLGFAHVQPVQRSQQFDEQHAIDFFIVNH